MSSAKRDEFGDLGKGTFRGRTFVVLRAILLNLCCGPSC
jgi:hypothetical protein